MLKQITRNSTYAFLIMLITNVMTANAEQGFQFEGKAYAIDSDTLLYSEHHQYLSPFIHKVEYKEPDGTVFARKTVNYTQSFYSPDFELQNDRNGELIRTERQNKKIILKYQENSQSDTEKDKLSPHPTLIIDAGFDHYITQNWTPLINGKSLTIDYLIPSMGDYYELTLKQVDCKNDENYCFSISASSFFIRIFSQELKLTYAKFAQSSQPDIYRLAQFQGRTNISDADGNYQDAIIHYSY